MAHHQPAGGTAEAVRAPISAVLPGVAIAAALAAVATCAGRAVPLLGAPVLAIVLGVALSARLGRAVAARRGITFASTRLLQLSVVLLGAQLSLGQVADVGLSSLPVMLGTLAACLLAAWIAGRLLGIERDLTVLIGVGTAICGASAIATVSPVLRARQHAVAYAISTIFAFNVAAVLVFPPLGHLLGLSQSAFGLFAGTAVNDTSSVVAAATSFGPVAANHAVVVKLVRTLMIIPVSLALGFLTRREAGDGGHQRIPGVPWFLVGFLLVASLNTAVAVPAGVHDVLRAVAGFLISTALGALGLSTDVTALRRAGFRPLVLGAILWIVVSTTSLALQVAG